MICLMASALVLISRAEAYIRAISIKEVHLASVDKYLLLPNKYTKGNGNKVKDMAMVSWKT